MTAAHLLYIPLVAIVGMVVGFIIGGRAARDRFNWERERERKREEARQKRAERKEARQAKEPDRGDGG